MSLNINFGLLFHLFCSANQLLTPLMGPCLPFSPLSVKSKLSKRCQQAWIPFLMVICYSDLTNHAWFPIVELLKTWPLVSDKGWFLQSRVWCIATSTEIEVTDSDCGPGKRRFSFFMSMRVLTSSTARHTPACRRPWISRDGMFSSLLQTQAPCPRGTCKADHESALQLLLLGSHR